MLVPNVRNNQPLRRIPCEYCFAVPEWASIYINHPIANFGCSPHLSFLLATRTYIISSTQLAFASSTQDLAELHLLQIQLTIEKMRSFLAALIFALCINLTFTRSINSKRDVCDVVNNQAADDACSMKKAFAGSSVYPQLVSEFSPLGALYVHFSEVIVGGAQQLTPSRVATKPNLLMALMRGPLSTHGAQMLSKKFVVMLVDFQPLARSAKPIWIQSGMTVNPSTSVMSSSIAPIVPYTAPNPQKGTGTHEYVFLVFEDRAPGLLASLPLHPQLTASLSGSFNLKTFRAQTGLQNLVAGSFFKSTHP
ncbi:hypothetical protein Pst134EB_016271 [Puccinia striiformis f. sp. tritici]|nr:hypothetical protein Pst134EB_016271 [Puccinia striiformis f. sp. tritici]